MIKVTVIKGPQFKFVEEKAYKLLHDILIKNHEAMASKCET